MWPLRWLGEEVVIGRAVYAVPVGSVFVPGYNYPFYQVRDVLRRRCMGFVANSTVVRPGVEVRAGGGNFYRHRFSRVFRGKRGLPGTLVLRDRLRRVVSGSVPGGLGNGPSGGRLRIVGGQLSSYCMYSEVR